MRSPVELTSLHRLQKGGAASASRVSFWSLFGLGEGFTVKLYTELENTHLALISPLGIPSDIRLGRLALTIDSYIRRRVHSCSSHLQQNGCIIPLYHM
jgi:hypothetical protein